MDARFVASQIANGRVAIGAGLVLAPRLFTRGWLGDAAATPAARVLAAGLGARDFAIGAGTASALRSGSAAAARQWLLAGALADAADFAATLALRGGLPKLGVAGVSALAGGAAAAGLWAARGLDQAAP
jgi:hypothetical protein